MPPISPLPLSRLHATFDPEKLPWQNSEKIPWRRLVKNGAALFHPRAMRALDLALGVNEPGFHVYLSGDPDLGRNYLLQSYLRPAAERMKTPDDLVYVHNFANPDEPRLISFPAGVGAKFRDAMKNLVDDICEDLAKRVDTAIYINRRGRLIESFHNFRAEMAHKMSLEAEREGFALDMDDKNDVVLTPLSSKKKIDASEAECPDSTAKLRLKTKGDRVAKNLLAYARKISRAEDDLRARERDLEREAMRLTLEAVFTPFERKFLTLSRDVKLKEYFKELREEILRDTEAFLPPDDKNKNDERRDPARMEDLFYRYEANLFVDNGSRNGAPIIVEDNPNYANLLGCVERESEMGALVTDFTLIKSGSLHKANGGFLVLRVDDLLRHPLAWEGLTRSLRANVARVEDGADPLDGVGRVKSLRPEPLPLNVKVILIGDEYDYEALLENDERFAKLFRVKAALSAETDRAKDNIRYYLANLARVIEEASLPPFDASALAWLVDLGSHLCEDQRKLSLKFPLLREAMLEGAAYAQSEGKAEVNAEILESAYGNKIFRENLLEEEYLQDYDRNFIKTPTSGVAIGQVNGLSVTDSGDFEFGLPQRISCAVGVGHDGVIDLEREADLGGSIHTKAMMILKSYLTSQFARKKPLVFSASLYFEQSYGGVEGDSASGAELVALLSALAETPTRLDLAFTGAVNHAGDILAVGGVTRKIEGFYKVCARGGLTGTQGVIIPADNVDCLMLSDDVLKSVEKGEFSIYSVRDIREALFLLTGVPAGKRRKDDTFTPGTLFYRVDRRLEALGYAAQNAFGKRRKND